MAAKAISSPPGAQLRLTERTCRDADRKGKNEACLRHAQSHAFILAWQNKPQGGVSPMAPEGSTEMKGC